MHQISTQTLCELQRRVPVIGDKALIDLVNGLSVSKDMLRYRKSRSFFGKLFDKFDGSNEKRRLILDGNLIVGQEALHDWMLELCDSLSITQVGLTETQRSLLEARNAIRSLKSQQADFQTLGLGLENLAKQFGDRIDKLEAKVRELEIRVAAKEDIDNIFAAWESEQTYENLPWLIQIVFLAQEVFSSSVTLYELEMGDREKYRQLLINKIVAASKQMPKGLIGFGELLTISCQELRKEDIELVASLLEVRSIHPHRILNTPYIFTIGTTLEMYALPNESRPNNPARHAIGLCHQQIESIPRMLEVRELVTYIVEEVADDCLGKVSRTF
jgi:YjcZ-like protein